MTNKEYIVQSGMTFSNFCDRFGDEKKSLSKILSDKFVPKYKVGDILFRASTHPKFCGGIAIIVELTDTAYVVDFHTNEGKIDHITREFINKDWEDSFVKLGVVEQSNEKPESSEG